MTVRSILLSRALLALPGLVAFAAPAHAQMGGLLGGVAQPAPANRQSPPPAPQASSRNEEACNNLPTRFSPEEQIRACTALLNANTLTSESIAIAYLKRGIGYLNLNDNANALANFDQAIRQNPQNRDAYANRGLVYFALRDDVRALGDLDQALRMNPQNAQVRTIRGFVNLRQNRFTDALADLEMSLRINPGDGNALYGRGVALQRLGRGAEGRADLDRAVAMAPAVASFFAQQGLPPAQQVAARRAPAVPAAAPSPDLAAMGPGELFAHADELDQRGQAQRARVVRRLLISRFPDSPLAVTAAQQLAGPARR